MEHGYNFYSHFGHCFLYNWFQTSFENLWIYVYLYCNIYCGFTQRYTISLASNDQNKSLVNINLKFVLKEPPNASFIRYNSLDIIFSIKKHQNNFIREILFLYYSNKKFLKSSVSEKATCCLWYSQS